ncbi:hypothetical protein LshimejAT787_0201780 [Lyophyllum shimeji]|uniref:Nascent polypeptide-associated complex subunit alpha-like UBA domain-containing protein n=1 Tax=Lyophyllum shimeji TaxID=47721 RepID=A0A9P3UIM5_LYOSH|nr:hypothetical protein LshimejAT787_0201780 [Lyophyllum shimeji]
MSQSNGRPEPEVIMNFADGFSYSKNRMEEAFRAGGILDRAPTKPAKDPAVTALKREDVDLIIQEFEIARPRAEKALAENGGDVVKTLLALITP